MKTYQYTSPEKTVVAVIDEDGLSRMSMLASALPEGTEVIPYTPPPLTVADFDAALTAHLDSVAQAKRYDNRITCMVRAGFDGPFQAEGQAFATWCDACNVVAYGLMAEVQAGTRPLPDTTQALIDLMPPMVWPD